MLRHVTRAKFGSGAAVPGDALTDAAKAAVASGDQLFEHRSHRVAACEIGVADQSAAQTGGAVMTTRAHRSDAVGKFDFANRFFFLGAALAQHRTGFDKHCGDDIVAAVDIGQQFFDQITAATVIPNVMMRIDDRQLGL